MELNSVLRLTFSTLRMPGCTRMFFFIAGKKVASVTLPGYGFHIVHRSRHPKLASIKAFVAWALAAA